jgi:hypothetical protein
MVSTDATAFALSPTEHQVQLRRAVIASTIGTAIEWYDFFLYSTVTGLYLKFRLYGVGYPTTEKRFFVSVWMLGVIRTFQTLKPVFVRYLRPFAARKKFG